MGHVLDRTNAQLLELLQKEGRLSVSELARTLGRAESTTRERVAMLEKRGFITGYRAILDPAKLGYSVHALLRADHGLSDLRELGAKLRAIPNVLSAQVTTGPKPIRIELLVDDLKKLEEVVSKRIATLDLREIEMALTVQRLVPGRPVPIRMDGEPTPAPIPADPAAAAEAAPLPPIEAPRRSPFSPSF